MQTHLHALVVLATLLEGPTPFDHDTDLHLRGNYKHSIQKERCTYIKNLCYRCASNHTVCSCKWTVRNSPLLRKFAIIDHDISLYPRGNHKSTMQNERSNRYSTFSNIDQNCNETRRQNKQYTHGIQYRFAHTNSLQSDFSVRVPFAKMKTS